MRRVAGALRAGVGGAPFGVGAIAHGRQKDPERERRLDAPLREELAERERLEIRERPRPVGVGQRAPFDADVGERRHLGRARAPRPAAA